MHTKHSSSTIHPTEAKGLALMRGFRRVAAIHSAFLFDRGPLHAAQVVTLLQAYTDHFEAVRRAKAEYERAVKQCNKALPNLAALCDEASEVVRQHFGSSEERMAEFGLEVSEAELGR